jgi:TolB-like protein
VRSTDQFRSAHAAGKLVRLTTGDGMALAFFTSPDAPVRCALQIAEGLRNRADLPLRMGIHSGPVDQVSDVNDRPNIAGAGINMAQRVMDCGDAGHILLSKRAADDLAQYPQWREHLHELGPIEVKHGVKLDVVNFYNDQTGNAELPEKFKQIREQTARADRLVLTRRRKRIVIGGALILAIVTSVVLSIFFYRSSSKIAPAAIPISDKSIAVLPFENLSKDEENAFFAGGVQDEILSNLAKVSDLKVISRTSVMKYKSGPERNLREIAKALGVSHVVEGSVQRVSGRVRVSAQLIDARSDAHVWAEHYDRDFADIFAIQSEIAHRIADQLQAKLSEAEKAAIAEQPTTDLVAYAYYTKAKELDTWSNWEGDEKNLNQKVELLEKATQRDPNFALAYCALAKTQVDLFGVMGRGDNYLDLAKKAAEAALRVRPDLGEAHLELARYYFYAGISTNNYDRAREELAIVRRKLPNNAEALMIEARIGRHENRWDASLANLQKANDLDPRNEDVEDLLGLTYLAMRRYSECEQLWAKQAGRGVPDRLGAQVLVARVKLVQGDPVAAQSVLEQVPMDYSPGFYIWDIRWTAALYLRDYDAANRILAAVPVPAKWTEIAFVGIQDAYGQIARARGDKQTAQAAFAPARKKMDAQQGDKPKDADYFATSARLDAGLGKKEEAIREALRAVELLPIAKESLQGPELVANLALVYAWTGERDRALEQLEIVATIPQGPTYGDLRFNPCWDDLRGDPRFDKIVAAAKAASR